MIVRFTVYGVPAPQGSKTAMLLGVWTRVNGARALINPRAVMVEGRNIRRKDGSMSDGRERHQRWRCAVSIEAAKKIAHEHGEKLDGPLSIETTFYMPRPPSVSKNVLYPAVKPDLDKLERAVNDGLKALIADDSRIVRSFAEKLYADNSRPRAIVMIETLPRTYRELKAAQLLAAHRKDMAHV